MDRLHDQHFSGAFDAGENSVCKKLSISSERVQCNISSTKFR